MKKKSFFLAVFFLVLFLFLARGLILKKALEHYLNRNFEIESSFERVNFGLSYLTADSISLGYGKNRFLGEDVFLKFSFFSLFDPGAYRVQVRNARVFLYEKGSFNFSLNPAGRHHFLRFSKVDLGPAQEEIDKLNFLLTLEKNSLDFSLFESSIFSPETKLSGRVNFSGLTSFCGGILLENFFIGDLIWLFLKPEELNLVGNFKGRIDFYWEKGKPPHFEADIKAVEKGVIDLKKREPLEFLKNHLDPGSYAYFLDSLRDYKYDRGRIGLEKKEKFIRVELDFHSDVLGSRKADIRLHRGKQEEE